MPTYQIKILPTAAKTLASFPRDIQVRIGRRIDSLSKDPRPPGEKALKGRDREVYRVRVGDYRVLYEIEEQVLLILVIKIGHRKDVYR